LNPNEPSPAANRAVSLKKAQEMGINPRRAWLTLGLVSTDPGPPPTRKNLRRESGNKSWKNLRAAI
jgi:hypothetical protein